MLKVTIYDGPGGAEASYITGVTEPGGKDKVIDISAQGDIVIVTFEGKRSKLFRGFRYILDSIYEKPIPKETK